MFKIRGAIQQVLIKLGIKPINFRENSRTTKNFGQVLNLNSFCIHGNLQNTEKNSQE